MSEQFISGLNDLGYKTETINNFVVFDYVILEGKFKNTKIKLGFELVQFPMELPHGPHFDSLELPINTQAKTHPERIHESNLFPGGRHLSRPYPDGLEKTVKAYMNYMDYLFNTL